MNGLSARYTCGSCNKKDAVKVWVLVAKVSQYSVAHRQLSAESCSLHDMLIPGLFFLIAILNVDQPVVHTAMLQKVGM